MPEPNETQFVLTQTYDHIFEIILNRPEKCNASHWLFMRAIGEAIDQAEKASGAEPLHTDRGFHDRSTGHAGKGGSGAAWEVRQGIHSWMEIE